MDVWAQISMKAVQFSIHVICVVSFVKLVQAVNTLQQGYSNLQYGHRMENAMINSYGDFSFLDCVKECLVTMRCKSVNYFKGANYCETNYEDKASAVDKFTTKTGWVYSERTHWPEVTVQLGEGLRWLCLLPNPFEFLN